MFEKYMDNDVYAVTSLKGLGGNKFVACQDSHFVIRLFKIDKLIKATRVTEKFKLIDLEIE